jgi:serine protease AprX
MEALTDEEVRNMTVQTIGQSRMAARPHDSTARILKEIFVESRSPGSADTVRLIVGDSDPCERDAIKRAFETGAARIALKDELPLIDAFAVEVSLAAAPALQELAKRCPHMKVYRDEPLEIPEKDWNDQESMGALMDVAPRALGVDRIWEMGITGKDVTIAVLDTGIDPHPDLKGRIAAFHDVINGRTEPYDDHSHGTHVSGIAAGTGAASQGRYRGVAPDAQLVGVKVIDKNGKGSTSTMIKGIQWVLENRDRYHIRVLNMSLGKTADESYTSDPVAQAVEKAWAAGIVPVIAAGNAGPDPKTIGSPGHAKNCITAGNLDDRGTPDRADDRISDKSSRGPTPFDGLMKPDTSAPGTAITAPKAGTDGYMAKSGTSMASPFVAGCAALMIQAKPAITPNEVKKLIYETGDKLPGVREEAQGAAGVIDPLEAVRRLVSDLERGNA